MTFGLPSFCRIKTILEEKLTTVDLPGTGETLKEGAVMNDRITNVEIQLMHHENTIQQLSDVITHQQLDIEKMQKEINLIMKHLQSATLPDMMASEDEEPPPHY